MRLLLLTGALLAALTGACANEYVGEDPPTDSLHFPVGIALRGDGQAALVGSSNFDLAYNRGVVHAIDLTQVDAAVAAGGGRAEAPIENALRGAVLAPSFAGQIRFHPEGDHAFVANRGDNTLVELELSGAANALELSCGEGGSSADDCTDGDHVIQLDGSDSYSVMVQGLGSQRARVLVGSLNGGKVSAVDARFDVDGPSRLTLPAVIESALLRASGLASAPATTTTPEYVLVVGELRPDSGQVGTPGAYLHVYQADGASYDQLGAWSLVGSNQAMDARAVAVSPNLARAYVAQRFPDSVAALDLSPSRTGLPLFRTIAVQAVGLRPTALAIDPNASAGPMVLVACYLDNTLYALDGDTLSVVAIVDDLGYGPADIAVDAERGRAYVTMFADDTIAVVDLDRPDHPGLEVVAHIGRPRPQPEESFSLDPLQWF